MSIAPESNAPVPMSRWVRWVTTEIQNIRSSVDRFLNNQKSADLSNNDTLGGLRDTILAIPLPTGYYNTLTNYSLAAARYVDITVPIPAGKTKVTLIAVGNVAALDTTSGGVAVAYATISASGSGFTWSTPQIPAGKDAGAANVNNIITPALGFQQSNLTGASFLVSMQVSASNPAAFPTNSNNYATLTLNAIFYN